MSELVGMTVELNVHKGSPKSENKLKEMVLTIYNESGFQLFFSLDKRMETREMSKW